MIGTCAQTSFRFHDRTFSFRDYLFSRCTLAEVTRHRIYLQTLIITSVHKNSFDLAIHQMNGAIRKHQIWNCRITGAELGLQSIHWYI